MTVTEEHIALLEKCTNTYKNDGTFTYHELYKFIDYFSDYIISKLGFDSDKSVLFITPLDLSIEKGKYKICCKFTVYYPNNDRYDTYLSKDFESNIFINPKSQRLTLSKTDEE